MKKLICIILSVLFLLSAASADERTLSIQKTLSVLGFFDGAQDGVYGERTEYAVSRLKAYLSFLGIETDGEGAVNKLLAGEISPYAADAKLSDASENVVRIQRRLRMLGYLPFKPDGVFGENTRRALSVYQHYSGLEPTGVADRATQEKLFCDSAVKAANVAHKKADKGDEVERLQERLALLGFFTGDIDAQYGAATADGVKAFQTYVKSSGVYSIDSRLTALDGVADPFILELLYSNEFNLAPSELSDGDGGQEVYRLQRRLILLGYLSGTTDGGYGQQTAAAVAAFQKAMGIKSAKCDKATLEALYSQSAKEAVKPYRITVDISDQRLYVYALDSDGGYTRLISTIVCSTGPDAQPGVYRAFTRPAEKLLKRESDYLRFVYRVDANIVISSIPYYDKSSFDKARLDALGSPMADGGVMVNVQNAKLIWEKCPPRTQVEIVE